MNSTNYNPTSSQTKRYSPSRASNLYATQNNRKSHGSRGKTPSKYSTSYRQHQGIDSRDLIIGQLKRDIIDMRATGKSVAGINSKLGSLEQKYRLLLDEKIISDKDARGTCDSNIRKIALLKSKVDTFKRQLENLNRNYENYMGDLTEMESLGQVKRIELERIRDNEREAIELRSRIEDDISSLRKKISKNKMSMRQIRDEIGIGNKKLDNLVEKDKDFDKKFAILEEEFRLKNNLLDDISRQLEQQEKQHESSDRTIDEKSQQLEEIIRALSELEDERDHKRREFERTNAQAATVRVNIKKQEGQNADIDENICAISLEIRNNGKAIKDKNSELGKIGCMKEEARNQNEELERQVWEIRKKIQAVVNVNREAISLMDDILFNDEKIMSNLAGYNTQTSSNPAYETGGFSSVKSMMNGSNM